MEILTIVSLIVGIIAGIIVLLEKFFHIFSRHKVSQKLFEAEFSAWKDSGFSYIPKHDKIRRFLGHIRDNTLDDERNIFALLCAIQHGDGSIHELIYKNLKNPLATSHVFNFVAGRGVRVGWRAEYVLTELNLKDLENYIKDLPDDVRNSKSISESIERCLNKSVEAFLEEQKKGKNQKLRTYAIEVLNQVRSRQAPVKRDVQIFHESK